MFILSDASIKSIKETPGFKAKLCLALDMGERNLEIILKKNEPNNDLTKLAALVVIRKETGWEDKKILKDISKEVVTAK